MTQTVIYCLHCGYANSANSRFCLQCGQAIVRLETPAAADVATKEALPEQPESEIKPARKKTTGSKTALELECPYCSSKMQVPSSVDQLICLECAAAFEVVRTDDAARLEILTF